MNGPYSKVHKRHKFFKNCRIFSQEMKTLPRRYEFQPAGQQLLSLSTLSAGEFYQAGQDASGQQ